MGIKHTVDLIPEKQWEQQDCLGFFDPVTHHITIRKGKPDATAQIYFHELCHAILHAMNKDKLYKDEAFVDLLASLLHQVTATSQK
jgi:hypothetical protein